MLKLHSLSLTTTFCLLFTRLCVCGGGGGLVPIFAARVYTTRPFSVPLCWRSAVHGDGAVGWFQPLSVVAIPFFTPVCLWVPITQDLVPSYMLALIFFHLLFLFGLVCFRILLVLSGPMTSPHSVSETVRSSFPYSAVSVPSKTSSGYCSLYIFIEIPYI